MSSSSGQRLFDRTPCFACLVGGVYDQTLWHSLSLFLQQRVKVSITCNNVSVVATFQQLQVQHATDNLTHQRALWLCNATPAAATAAATSARHLHSAAWQRQWEFMRDYAQRNRGERERQAPMLPCFLFLFSFSLSLFLFLTVTHKSQDFAIVRFIPLAIAQFLSAPQATHSFTHFLVFSYTQQAHIHTQLALLSFSSIPP